LYRQIISYYEKHADEMKAKYSNFKSFNQTFEVPVSIADSVFAQAKKEKLEFTDEEKAETLPHINILAKAIMARDMWTASEYFEVINTTRDDYKEAVRVISDKNKYTVKLSKP
jgi:carboxyl-terminal processing protease